MWVQHAALEDFRNYRREAVEFHHGLNLVIGRNAQGKTNLLEAVYCLSGLGSPRGRDVNLVRSGAERALLHADVVRNARSVHIDLELRPGARARVLINRTPAAGTRALRELTSAVFFGPDDPLLIKGAPEGRRRFIDDLIVKLRPARESLRREWDRILKQRNTLLKSIPRSGSAGASATATLEVWDESFCRVGSELVAARLEALWALVPFARKRYEEIAGGGRIELTYESEYVPAADGTMETEQIRESLERSLRTVRAREFERGVSLVGPHRDDVAVRLANAQTEGAPLDARTFASQGDQRTSALALKLGEHDLLTDALGEEPVLLLDDVLSELDPGRRGYLLETVTGRGQTFVSSAEDDVLSDQRDARVIEVSQGRFRIHD